jgi:hypothetical protein
VLNIVLLATVGLGILVASIINYYLNLAPGADPNDFQVGPNELGITCDCYLNMLIISSIVVLALALSSYMFDSAIEVVVLGIIGFVVVTLAGYYGRRKRYRHWEDMEDMLDRVIPRGRIRRPIDDTIDLFFDDDDQ